MADSEACGFRYVLIASASGSSRDARADVRCGVTLRVARLRFPDRAYRRDPDARSRLDRPRSGRAE